MSPADLDSPDREREERDGAPGTPTADASPSPLLTQGTLIGIPAPVSPRELLQLAKARLKEDGVAPNVTQLGRKRIWDVRPDPFNDMTGHAMDGHARVNAIEATVRTLPSAPALGSVWQEGQAVLRERRARKGSAILEEPDEGRVADVEPPGRRRQHRGSLMARLAAGAAAGVFMAVVAVAAFHTKAQEGESEAWRPKATVPASRSVDPLTSASDPKDPALGKATQPVGATDRETATPHVEQGSGVGTAAAKLETGAPLAGQVHQSGADEPTEPAATKAEVAANVPETREKTKVRVSSSESFKAPDITRGRKDMSGDEEPPSVEPRPFQPVIDSASGRAGAAAGIVGSASGRPEQINAPSLGTRPTNEGSASSAPPATNPGRSRVDNRSNADPDAILPLSLD